LYRGYVFGLPLRAYPQRLLAWAGLMARQFTPVGASLAALGLSNLWRSKRTLALSSGLSFGAFSLYAIGYNTSDSLVYLVMALPLAALWMGSGLAQAAGWLRERMRWGDWLILLLPALQLVLFWGQMDVSEDRMAMEWASRVLEEAPGRAVLLSSQDAQTFTLWYAHDALGSRPDVVVVDRDLWGQAHYRQTLAGALGIARTDGGLTPEEAAGRMERPVVVVAPVELP
jgi:hypothetical protein